MFQQEGDDDVLKVFSIDCVSWICESTYLNIGEKKSNKNNIFIVKAVVGLWRLFFFFALSETSLVGYR